MPEPRRTNLPCALIGGALVAAGAFVPLAFRAPAIHGLLVERPFAECVAHGEDRTEFATLLAREADDLSVSLQRILFASGAAIAAVALVRRLTPAGWPLVAAVLLAGDQLVVQLGRLRAGVSDGLFTESDERSRVRFFDGAAAAAQVLNATIPPGSRYLVIDFASSNDVNKIDYLSFPRRMFTLPSQIARMDADRFRQLMVDRPDALRECRDAGYDFAVDLKRLVMTLSPSAIVSLQEGC